MRQKIIISVCILIFLISFYEVTTPELTGISFNSGQSLMDSFIVGATDNAWQNNNDTLANRLGHNVWHKYAHEGNGWRHVGASGDFLFADSAEYYQQVKSVINDNASDNLLTTMDRGKISLLAWSQRSDYQCEQTLEDSDYWFYGYGTHGTGNMDDYVDETIHGAGERVRHCWPNTHTTDGGQGWVVKDLKANREQINRHWWQELNDSCVWMIKPRIRIDSAYANNPANFTKPVCKIEVLDFNGNPIKTADILVRNFRQEFDSVYSGKYLDEFYFTTLSWNDTSNLIIHDSISFNPDKKGLGDESCQVDFRVWYYGNCDMWIDRIRVDNEVAHRLLSGTDNDFENWLRWESNLAMENPDHIWNFYLEEFEFNNTPSIAYVNKKIKHYTEERFSLMVNFHQPLYKVHLPNHGQFLFSADLINKYLFETAEIETWWNVSYSLEGWSRSDSISLGGIPNYHSSTLSSSDYDSTNGILSYKTTPQAYDDWLQTHLDEGPSSTIYTNWMKQADTLNKLNGKSVINLMQVHMWHNTDHKLKEPSNEELELTSMLPLTYGLKGIMYYTYSSVGTIGEQFFYRGIIEPGKTPITPRYSNVYGQPKWDKLKQISANLRKLGPHLMSFDNTNRQSYIYRLSDERNEMCSSTFINELKAFPPLEFAPPEDPHELDSWLSSNPPDSANKTYLQAAFFNKPNDTEINKYFMIVNRRCAPYVDNTSADNLGGRRLVTMKVNPSQFSGFENWVIYDLEDGDSVAAFNKNSSNFVYLGDFMPGQGKLFRVAPVMQEGGTLIADEVVTGISFTCKAPVFNNGHDLTIEYGVTVEFLQV